jgi:hypothetical protein
VGNLGAGSGDWSELISGSAQDKNRKISAQLRLKQNVRHRRVPSMPVANMEKDAVGMARELGLRRLRFSNIKGSMHADDNMVMERTGQSASQGAMGSAALRSAPLTRAQRSETFSGTATPPPFASFNFPYKHAALRSPSMNAATATAPSSPIATNAMSGIMSPAVEYFASKLTGLTRRASAYFSSSKDTSLPNKMPPIEYDDPFDKLDQAHEIDRYASLLRRSRLLKMTGWQQAQQPPALFLNENHPVEDWPSISSTADIRWEDWVAEYMAAHKDQPMPSVLSHMSTWWASVQKQVDEEDE